MTYYKEDRFSLLHGDCLTLLKKINSESVDMIFADPPYFLSDGSITCNNGKMVSVKKASWDQKKEFDDKLQFHHSWIKECRRVLKPNGTIWISGTYHSIYLCGYELQIQDFRIINDICWFKPNAPPNLTRKCFTASHETLIWAIKDKDGKQFFNYDLMRSGSWENDKLKSPGKQMRSVWSLVSSRKSEKKWGRHPTQKPLSLLKRIVLASTKEGDLILDPFNGSGTTGIASYELNRKYIGIDIEEEYLKLTLKRLNEKKNDI